MQTIHRFLLILVTAILSACTGGGGGSGDTYLLGGGNEGTGVEIKELVQVEGVVLDETDRPVNGTATINAGFAANISDGKFKVSVPLATGETSVTIAIEQAGKDVGVVKIESVVSADVEALVAYIQIKDSGPTLADVTFTKRGAASTLSAGAREDLETVDGIVNDGSGTARDGRTDGPGQDQGSPPSNPEFDPELVGVL